MKILESRRSELLLQFFFALVVVEYNYKLSSLQGTMLTHVLIWIFLLPLVTALCFKLMSYFFFKDLIYAKAAIIVFQALSYCTLILKSDTVIDIFFYWSLAIVTFCLIMPFYLIKLSHLCCRLTK